MEILILVLLAGGGIYAAFDGLFGVVAKKDAQAVAAKVEAELKKAETSSVAEVKKLIADIRAKI